MKITVEHNGAAHAIDITDQPCPDCAELKAALAASEATIVELRRELDEQGSELSEARDRIRSGA